MLDPHLHRALAEELHNAEQSRRQLDHFSKRYPEMTLADSYAIQRAWLAISATRAVVSSVTRSGSRRGRCRLPRRSPNLTTAHCWMTC